MSYPTARQHPDTTTPALEGQGLVCPRCERHFERVPGAPTHCPADGNLLRAADISGPKADPMIGRVFGEKFSVVSKLGAGSMGAVYRARQANIHRDVALKILRSDKAMDEASKARFLREARANSVLVSPHTVTVFDFGESPSGELYLVMELLEGESLGQRLQRDKRLSARDAVDLGCQALRSLAEAHAKGIVHRDLKPDNLFFAKVVNASGVAEEIVKVLDFGIAKMFGEGAGPMNAIETQAGTVFGTPRYMSPEQAQAKPLDARSDLYSLGVILYHVLTGRPPFTDDDAIIVMARHIKTQPKTLNEACPEANVPLELERTVLRAMSKNAADRPANADAMAAELLRALEASSGSTSGVRTSLASGLFDGRRVPSVRPPPMSPTSSGDSLELPVTPPVAKRSVLYGVVAFVLAAGCIVAVLLFVLNNPSSRAHATVTPPPTSDPTVTPTAAVATTAAAVVDTAPKVVIPPPPPATATATAPVVAAPSGLAHTGHGHGPHQVPSAKPSATTTARPPPTQGYGILE